MGSSTGAVKAAATRLGISLLGYMQHVNAGEKWCHACMMWKLIECFGLDRSRSDGASAKCSECVRARYVPRPRGPSPLRGVHMSTKAKQRMRDAHTGKNNHRWKGGVSPTRKRDPRKLAARRAVNHAIEAGRLARPASLPCFHCGGNAEEYHHYKGYSAAHWLDVRALCRRCHRKQRT